MKKVFLPVIGLIISFTQTACNSNGLSSVNLNEKFISMVNSYDKNTNNGSAKAGYSKAGISQNNSENKLTTKLTDIKEFQVNRFGTGNGHRTPVVAMSNQSNFVVTWQQQSDIFAQVYDSNGIKQGDEFMVNEPVHILYDQKNLPEYINTMDSPKVAIDQKGNFIVVWEQLQREFNSQKTVSVNSDIFARSFDRNGNPLNNQFKVNILDKELHKFPDVAANSNGDFIISWSNFNLDGSSAGIYARKFNQQALANNPFLVTKNTGDNCESSVSINEQGKFIVSWYNLSDNNVYARLFESNGNSAGKDFNVNNSPDGQLGFPRVAMDKTGNFVVTWQKTSDDGSVFGVFARKYDEMGNAETQEFRVNSNTNNPYFQYDPAIAMNTNGNFVITWQNLNKNLKGEGGIFAQKFNNSGNKLGNEFLVKTYSGVEETRPSAAIDSSNNFVITWTDAGIHAKMFDSKVF
jgi:hypothetical protein